MSDTLGRFIARVPAGTASGSDLTYDLRALSSVYGHLVVSDLNHASNENPLRTLFTHRGFVGAKSLYGAPYFDAGTAPTPEAINYTNPIDATGEYTGRASLRMGSHAIHRVGATLQWPKVQLQCRVKAPSTYTVGIVLAVCHGRNSAPSNAIGVRAWANTTVTSTTYVDTTLTVALVDSHLGREHVEIASGSTARGTAPLAESSDREMITVWMGAYCTSGSAAAVGSIAGITCYLLEP